MGLGPQEWHLRFVRFVRLSTKSHIRLAYRFLVHVSTPQVNFPNLSGIIRAFVRLIVSQELMNDVGPGKPIKREFGCITRRARLMKISIASSESSLYIYIYMFTICCLRWFSKEHSLREYYSKFICTSVRYHAQSVRKPFRPLLSHLVGTKVHTSKEVEQNLMNLSTNYSGVVNTTMYTYHS